MLSESDVRRLAMYEMKRGSGSLTSFYAYKEVLEEDSDFWVFPSGDYAEEGYELMVAYIPYPHRESKELEAIVNIYDKHGKLLKTTDGWLLTEFKEVEYMRGWLKPTTRQLYLPKVEMLADWEIECGMFFENGQPLKEYDDEDELHSIDWCNVVTGALLYS